jgi:hypothetical protein
VIALLIAAPSVVIFAVGFVLMGRATYARKRPFTEPLACERPAACFHTHYSGCYRRPGTLVDSDSEAVWTALLYGVGWPAVLTACAVAALGRLVLSSRKPLPGEVDARNARLERELGLEDKP